MKRDLLRAVALLSLLGTAWYAGCSRHDDGETSTVLLLDPMSNVAPARIVEVMQGESTTYLRVQEAQWDFWVATPSLQAQPGQYVVMGQGPERTQVHDALLNHTFDSVLDIAEVRIVSEEQAQGALRIEPLADGFTVAAVYAERERLSGQAIRVRGRIVKVNRGVFGTNWYHIQDGTGGDGTNDLTVTSDAELNVGDLVVASGNLTINKDFGFGYFYEVIVEGGQIMPSPLTDG